MPGHIASQTLFRSGHCQVRDVRCTCPRCGRGREETSLSHSLVFVRSGVFISHVRSRTVVADPNHAVFFSRNEPYRVSHPVDGGDRCLSISLSPGVLEDAFTEFGAGSDPDRPLPLTHAPADAPAYLAQSRLDALLAAAPGSALAVDSLVCDLVHAVLCGASRAGAIPRPRRASTDAAHAELADRAKCALARGFRQRLDLGAVARQVHASPYHLCRVFRRLTGLTLQRYANRLRLREALGRVAGGDDDLTRVALASGFYDHSHFANAFRREFGVPPSSCRRTLEQMSNSLQV